MRGDDNQQEGMFSYISPEKRVPADHPLRPIRKMVDEILKEMSPQFAKLYSEVGRPSIAPERLFRSLLLQIFYSVRSERMLIEQLQYNLLFRWFVGMEMDEAVWNHAVFSKNRERLLNEEIAESFFQRVLERARPYMSDEHFTVDGTLIEAWASQKSFRRKDGTGEAARTGRGGRLSRGEAEEPNPWIDDGSRCSVVQEVQRQRGEARLPGTCIDGEPQRTFGADVSDRGQRKSGTGCRDADGGSHPTGEASDFGRRQELRHAGIRTGTPRDEHHPACGAERYEPQQCGGRADHAACGI